MNGCVHPFRVLFRSRQAWYASKQTQQAWLRTYRRAYVHIQPTVVKPENRRVRCAGHLTEEACALLTVELGFDELLPQDTSIMQACGSKMKRE